MLAKIKTLLSKIHGVALFVCGLSIAIMVVYGFLDVSARNILNQPLYGAYEISEILLVVVVFLSLAACETEGRHMRVDFVFAYISQSLRRVIDIAAYLCGIVVCGLMIFYSARTALNSWRIDEHSEGIIAFPIYPSKIVIVIGLILLAIELLVGLIDALMKFKANQECPRDTGPDISHASDQI
ncbi:MAG TPA: TRAP transporter small permease [Smithellaceae bacterium]|nr:TRAP transporter small permease [Smithellaceae bacterium]